MIPLDVTEKVRKQILLELKTLYEARSPYVVCFYGAFFTEVLFCFLHCDHREFTIPQGSISIALEYMDGGSLLNLIRHDPVPEPILARLVEQVCSWRDRLDPLHAF